MEQYYRPVLQDADGEIKVLNMYVDGKYMVAKLTEHSWWENPLPCTIAAWLYEYGPMRLAWVGDYAANVKTDFAIKMKQIAFGDDNTEVEGEVITSDILLLDNLVILNHTKRLYLCCNEYFIKSRDSDGWVMHPLPLLTAIGNGLGGGDYHGVNEELVGCWAFDLLEVDDKVREGYSKFDVFWKED